MPRCALLSGKESFGYGKVVCEVGHSGSRGFSPKSWSFRVTFSLLFGFAMLDFSFMQVALLRLSSLLKGMNLSFFFSGTA